MPPIIGTEWCGAGSVATDEKEVGLFQSSDKCCRTHDLCKMYLASGVSELGLMNNGMFTR